MLGLAIVVAALAIPSADAQTRKPTAQEVAAIRNCASKYQDDVDEGERQCVFNLVATPCTNTREGSSNLGTADCYRVEWVIWDNLLNDNFKKLMDALDNQQSAKLRAMRQAWIAYRDTTCNFYMDKIQGSMAIPMGAACAARETPGGRCCCGFSIRSDRVRRSCSSEPPIVFQHRIEQDLRAGGALLLRRPLRFVV
jgi:uncharacterized protein YecT (DUF1311 family)